MSYAWQRFKIWQDLSPEVFENSFWQDKNALIHPRQLTPRWKAWRHLS